jgi:hypothetical protein
MKAFSEAQLIDIRNRAEFLEEAVGTIQRYSRQCDEDALDRIDQSLGGIFDDVVALIEFARGQRNT